ncbi:MAG: lipoyl(octanoyl) transferase LipB [Phycisphaerae bacterium]|nr:lipoyl(octanoyl) transferase LipB [Phycisphaerae bacterium]
MPLTCTDLGVMPYQDAYEVQAAWVERIVAARESKTPILGHLLLVEHPAVITVSNRPGAAGHVLASAERLQSEGVTVARTDRGGDVTYHGPGQVVAYPIIDLNAAGLRLHEYMRLLEDAVMAACAGFGLRARRDPGATGVWTDGEPSRKVCAMGVRVRRWISMHGLALNVSPNLRHFDLIVPCGLSGRGVTSLREELGPRCPSMDEAKRALVEALSARIEEAARRRRERLTAGGGASPAGPSSP